MEINEIESKKTIEKLRKQRDGFFKKIKKIDKPLAILTSEKREKN